MSCIHLWLNEWQYCAHVDADYSDVHRCAECRMASITNGPAPVADRYEVSNPGQTLLTELQAASGAATCCISSDFRSSTDSQSLL